MAATPSPNAPFYVTTPAGGACELIYSDTALPNSIVAGEWFGPDGAYGGFMVGDSLFDLRAYRIIHATWRLATIVGGVAPTANLLALKVDDKGAMASVGQLNQLSVTGTIPAGGGCIEMYAGDMTPLTGMAIGGSYNINMAGFVGRIEFCKFGFGFSGSPTGITGGRFYLWGYR